MFEQGGFYMFFLFLIYLFVNSEVMLQRVFHEIPGATGALTTNSYGTILQGILLVFMYSIVVIAGEYFWDKGDGDESDEEIEELSVMDTFKKKMKLK